MKNLDYTPIELSDNACYREHLALCEDICADWSTALLWGYSQMVPTTRAYADDLCWQHIYEHGEDLEYPPLGNWDRTDWPQLFEKYVTPGTVFDYVPECLKDRWEAIFPGQFTITTNRNKWDYIYDMEKLPTCNREMRRYSKKFNDSYDFEVVPINAEMKDDIIKLCSTAEFRIKETYESGADLTELEEDDKAMMRVLDDWDAFDTIEGILLRVGDRYISYQIWDVVDDRIIGLFSKNIYEFVGVHEAGTGALCRANLERGRRWANYADDAGFEGLRKAKMNRKPAKLLKKYRMIWNS